VVDDAGIPPKGDGRYRFLIDQLREAVMIYTVVRDDDGQITDWIVDDTNPAAQNTLTRPFDIRGHSASELFGAETMKPYIEISRRLDGTRDVEKFETYFAHDKRHYASSVFFISEDLYVNVAEDITERKRSEEERFSLQNQLHLAKKMEALGLLAGGIAHDFNNIIQPILGHVDLLSSRDGFDDEMRGDLDVIRQAALRASALTRQILAFSRHELLDPEVSEIEPMIRESLAMMRAALPANIRLVEDIQPSAPPAKVTSTGIHQVIVNLLTNAHQAMSTRGGTITIGLAHVSRPPQNLPTNANGWLRLWVEDDGPGIPPDHVERVFDPFFTTKTKREGTGLGLAVVHGTVAGFGGSIDVDSGEDWGTRFDVWLPVAAGQDHHTAATPTAQRRGNGERLLLVDDEPMIVAAMLRLLEHRGYTVEGHTDPREALESFRDAPTRFDAVITDMTMPGISGLELASRVSELRPGIPVVACSGYHDGFHGEDLRTSGITRTLVKPMVISDLVDVLHEVMGTPKP
jgi:signal transduction histidine kinase/ActR/RegA family two-component response regulator